uniref:NADH-ubiquinone oxidoreductase chain 6 n=1 Tax=Mileewa sharpa TaxID=2984023 RepID=A0A977TM29_9HEMI|nr:NADH dehydrogenase subunit 6 [Mileewa sharpa]UXX17563.1 NADH dehydrogenase subunit 6 [Mileewa sharpa]
MKFILIKIMIIISSMITFLKNPVSMGIMLMIQTIITTLLMNKMISSSWMSMITYLMMIGGLLILFMYMSSIASNEKFKMNIFMFTIVIIMLMLTDEMLLNNQINEMIEINETKSIEKLSMIKLYNYKSMILSMILVIYLLYTMIVITKIIKHYKGPLRSKNYE